MAETTYFWDNKFIIDRESMKADPKNKKYGWPKNDAKYTIYTDGSLVKKPIESAGCGVYIWQGYASEAYRLGPNVTVYQSEVQGIKKAAQFLLKNNREVRGEKCVIYVDNQAAIKSLGNHKTKSKLVINTVRLLNAAASKCDQLIIRWCRSHQPEPEFVGNSNADFLANSAAKNMDLAVAYDAPRPSMSTIKAIWRDKIDDLWSFNWSHLNECRQSKLFFPYVDRGRSFAIVNSPRRLWGVLNQFFTGHAFNNYHNYLVFRHQDEEISPECDLCHYNNSVQSSEHIIGVCPYFFGLRSQIFGFPILEPPYTLSKSKVCQFLLQSGLDFLQWKDVGVNNTA